MSQFAYLIQNPYKNHNKHPSFMHYSPDQPSLPKNLHQIKRLVFISGHTKNMPLDYICGFSALLNIRFGSLSRVREELNEN